MRMSNIVQDMFTKSIAIFENYSPEVIESIHDNDDNVDLLNRDIKFYLARISEESLSEEQAQEQLSLLSVPAAIEEIGDIISQNLTKLARKYTDAGITFSEDGLKDLKELHRRTLDNITLANTAFATQNQEIAIKVINNKRRIGDTLEEFQQKHLERLREEVDASRSSSGIHMEVLALLVRINVLITKLARTTLRSRSSDDR